MCKEKYKGLLVDLTLKLDVVDGDTIVDLTLKLDVVDVVLLMEIRS